MLFKKNGINSYKVIDLKQIKELIQKIQKVYTLIYQHFLEFFKFPFDISEKIIENVNNIIENQNQNNIKALDALSNQIKAFSEAIKKSSYENNSFNEIKEENEKLLQIKQKLDNDIIYNPPKRNITPPKNFFDQEEESFCDRISVIQNNEEDKINQISLECNICDKKAEYLCNHCFEYICDNCKKDKSKDDIINLHIYEKIDEENELQKIKCVNSIIYMIKKYSLIADTIFKSREKNIEYPELKNVEEIYSQKEFLINVSNLNNIALNKNNKTSMCQIIKHNIINSLEADEGSISKKKDNDFYSTEGLISFIDNDKHYEGSTFSYFFKEGKLMFLKLKKKGESSFESYLLEYESIKQQNIPKDKLNFKGKYILPTVYYVHEKYKYFKEHTEENKIYKSIHTNAKKIKNFLPEIKENLSNIIFKFLNN